jgi:hypothetical protein
VPISRIGRIAEIVRAANPTPVAKIDAVHATNLFASAKSCCSSTERSGGRSTKRECRYTSVAVAVPRIVIGTMGETRVKVPPVAPMYPMENARQTPSVTRKASSVRSERYRKRFNATTKARKSPK